LEIEEKPVSAVLPIGTIVKVDSLYYVRCRDYVLKIADYQMS